MQSVSIKRKFPLWIEVLLSMTAVLLFGFVIFKTSPYRLLRPYIPLFAEKLIHTDHRKSASGNEWVVLIPASTSGFKEDFWIDQIPVTTSEYLKCVNRGECPKLQHKGFFQTFISNPLYRSFPVTYLSWQNAQDYCFLLGGSLPSEAQWNAAAGLATGNIYPWGNAEPNLQRANFDGLYQGLTPAGWLPEGASPFGILDMAGNVREWTLDEINPEDADEGDITRVLKGGSSSDYPDVLEISAFQWHSQYSAGFNRGFRCVYPAD